MTRITGNPRKESSRWVFCITRNESTNISNKKSKETGSFVQKLDGFENDQLEIFGKLFKALIGDFLVRVTIWGNFIACLDFLDRLSYKLIWNFWGF
jgi:hypothetical protein